MAYRECLTQSPSPPSVGKVQIWTPKVRSITSKLNPWCESDSTVTQQLKKGIEAKNERWSAACLLKMVTFVVHKLILLQPRGTGQGKWCAALPVRG